MVPRLSYIQFFDAYQELRDTYNFLPEFIINIDETMVDVITNPQKVILFKDDLNPVVTEPKKLEHMTLLLSLPAAGDSMRPLVILPLITVPHLNDEVKCYYDFSGQPSGWITGEILKTWIENQFMRQINERRAKYGQNCPVLVILDNHSSRKSIDQEMMWREHTVKFLFIPPHTSHVIQPLDKCPNLMYKKLLSRSYEPHSDDSTNVRRNRVLLASIEALQTSLSPHYRSSGWRATGLFPMNRERILEGEFIPKDINDEKPILTNPKKRKIIKLQEGNKKKVKL
jgi:hypothetical protein